MMRKLMMAASAALVLTTFGCQQAKTAPQAKGAPAPATAQKPASANQAAPAAPKRRLVVDEKGNAYEVLEAHERLCQNCDR